MPYDPMIVKPMKAELTAVGFEELLTPNDVDLAVKRPGTALVVVNSVCGCAAGGARPGVALAVKHEVKPDHLFTVFAGQDLEAVQRMREYFPGQPPSSPSIALLRDGELVGFMPRHAIEGNMPESIASALINAFDKICAKQAA
ncbi:MAG: BrxA/BrxB family bacilliredoxin [Bacteroidetes bacterium]|nr:BrxA/BrxB family bacilliredoxin [Bacteroidota bacterium]